MFQNDLFLAAYVRDRQNELRQFAAARALVAPARAGDHVPLRVRLGRLLVRLGVRLATGRSASRVSSLTGKGHVIYEGFFSGTSLG